MLALSSFRCDILTSCRNIFLQNSNAYEIHKVVVILPTKAKEQDLVVAHNPLHNE